MKIAITFLTCGRAEYTARTLESLCHHNPDLKDNSILIHGDDFSAEGRSTNCLMAEQAGFQSILLPKKQQGVAKMTAQLFEIAANQGADSILNLQNDWESSRAIPFGEITDILSSRQDIYCVRLYGAWKSHTGRCGIHHGGREPRQVVEWSSNGVPAGYEVGDIHWGHPPSVTRIREAMRLTQGMDTESQSRSLSGKLTALTARTIDNVFWHIGRERTPGFHA
jgi:hypothetical protein